MMPDMNGYEVLEHVKADASLARRSDHHDFGARRDRQRHPMHRARRRRLPQQAVQSCSSARARRCACWKRSACATRCGEISRAWRRRWTPRARCNSACCRASFPPVRPAQPVAVHALMQPAREVGGDLYDCFYAGDHTFCFLVGDVSGKGASAAMFMARTRSLVRMSVELWRQWRTDEVQPAATGRSGQPRALPEQRRAHVRHVVSRAVRYPHRRAVVHQCWPSGPASACAAAAPPRRSKQSPGLPLGVRANTLNMKAGPSPCSRAMRCSFVQTACSRH